MSATKTSELFNQRSFVYRKIDAVTVKNLGNSALVTKVVSEKNSQELAANLALIDLSVATRIGFRGINVRSHLDAAKLPVPSKPNMMQQSEDASLMTLRLSENEYWVLNGSTTMGQTLQELSALPVPDNCYRLYCQNSHAWFMLTGKYIEQTLAKICGVDLREPSFPLGAIVQTSVARVNAIMVRHKVNNIAVFSILSDSSSAEYLWDSLLDAMNEFNGHVAGTDALGIN
jgi:sarcosine oxidase subunit gamma